MIGNLSTTTTEGRRRWAGIALATTAVVALAVLAARFLPSTKTLLGTRHKPAAANIILITLDTVRPDRLSCYGSRIVATPNIDALAAGGVRFTNAASTVPLTLPAHASIMTGLYPPAHGVRDNVGYVLDRRIPTLAEVLHGNGWITAGFVSAFVLDRRWGIARGFDHYFDDFDLRGMAAGESADIASVQRDGAATVAAAVSWLDARPAGRPFFLWLHLYDAHEPYTPKEPFKSRYPGRPYDAEVAYTDSIVGEFRRALADRGLLDRSLVILTSDHGEGLGDHGESSHGYFVYDSTIKAALIMKLPSGDGAGRVVDKAVSHVDVMPTVLDIAGVPLPAKLHGRSLAPLLSGGKPAWDRPVYSESMYPLLHYGWAPLRAVRSERDKLIDVPRAELYDLTRDPDEKQNIHQQQPQRAKELTVALADLRHAIEKRERIDAGPAATDDESIAKLQSLGYLAGQSGAGADDDGGRSRTDPKDRVQLHEKIMAAQGFLESHEAAPARHLLEEVLAQDDAICDAQAMLGEIEVEDRRPEAAIPHFRRALALNPKHERSLFGLAKAYAVLGRYDSALTGYRRVLEIKGSDARASLAIADTYMQLGDLERAASTLEQASAKGEASPFFVNKLGEVRAQQGRDEQAAALFERAAAADVRFALPRFNLGVIDEKRGNLRGAMEQYEQALKLEPAFCRAQFNLGRLYASTGNVAGARQLWEASLKSCPGFIEGRFYLAKLLIDSGGDLARAEELVRAGIGLDPAHTAGPLGYYVLADLLNRTGRSAEARKATETGRRIEAGMR